MSIKLTKNAAKEIKKVMEEQSMKTEEYALRVSVQGGGCSGYNYSLGFEEKKEGDALNDSTYTLEGIETRVDRKSELFIDGTEIDFVEDLNKRGFAFSNPNAKNCGCGSSFQVK